MAAYLLGNQRRRHGQGNHGQTAVVFDELTTAVQLAGGGVKGKLPGLYRMEDIGEA